MTPRYRIRLVVDDILGNVKHESARTWSAIDHPNYSPDMAIKQLANALAHDLIEHLRGGQ